MIRLEDGEGYHVRREAYLEPSAIAFIQDMGSAFAQTFPGSVFDISSAGRSEEHQRQIIEKQKNPFAADPEASTHPFFITFDLPLSSLGYRTEATTAEGEETTKKVFSKELAEQQTKWVTDYLVAQEKSRLAQAKFENKNCFHVATFPFAIPNNVWKALKEETRVVWNPSIKETTPPVASVVEPEPGSEPEPDSKPEYPALNEKTPPWL